MDEPEEIDYEWTPEVVCPYCGYEQRDSWELTEDTGETYCDECERTFGYQRFTEYTYTTTKKED